MRAFRCQKREMLWVIEMLDEVETSTGEVDWSFADWSSILIYLLRFQHCVSTRSIKNLKIDLMKSSAGWLDATWQISNSQHSFVANLLLNRSKGFSWLVCHTPSECCGANKKVQLKFFSNCFLLFHSLAPRNLIKMYRFDCKWAIGSLLWKMQDVMQLICSTNRFT